MAKKQISTISTFQAHWHRLLWTPVRKIGESREEKGMGLLIHLRCCEGRPPIVDDLAADGFLLALRRFIARWANPSEIISDNAAQFKLSKSTINVTWQKVIKDPSGQSYISNLGIKWPFIIELSPWRGGFYERLVGSSKMALTKSIGKNYLISLQL